MTASSPVPQYQPAPAPQGPEPTGLEPTGLGRALFFAQVVGWMGVLVLFTVAPIMIIVCWVLSAITLASDDARRARALPKGSARCQAAMWVTIFVCAAFVEDVVDVEEPAAASLAHRVFGIDVNVTMAIAIALLVVFAVLAVASSILAFKKPSDGASARA